MPKSGTQDALVNARDVAVEDRLALCEAVLQGMAEGKMLKETVEAEAKRHGISVTPGTVRTWFALDEGLVARYQRMKPLLGQAFAEEAVQIARDSTRHSTVEDKLLIETLRWAASKMAPLEFGDRQVVEHQGNQTLKVEIVEEEAPKAVSAGTVRQLEAAVETAVLSSVTVPVLGSGLDAE